MSDEIHIFASLTAKPGQEAALRQGLTALVGQTREEPGNLHYMLHEDTAKPGNFYVFEVYRDQAAADAHLAAPYLKQALKDAEALLAREPYIHQTKLIAGA